VRCSGDISIRPISATARARNIAEARPRSCAVNAACSASPTRRAPFSCAVSARAGRNRLRVWPLELSDDAIGGLIAQSIYTPVGRIMTRYARRLRGALRPMTQSGIALG
jgi:hypothetical protein